MRDDLDLMEEAFGYFVRVFTRPRYWEDVQYGAKVAIDRPSAYLLRAVCDDEAGYTLHELATKLGIEPPSVTRTVQRLESDKLIARTVDPADRRVTRLQPTRLGRRTVANLRRAKRQRLRTLFSSWSAADRQQLARLLHRLATDADKASTTR